MGSREVAVPFKRWRGLNIRDDSAALNESEQGSEMADCVNFDLKPGGTLAKRKGFKTVHTGGTLGASKSKLLGPFVTASFTRLIAATATKVFYSTDGATWTEILLSGASIANVEWGVQYTDNFYLIRRGGTVVKWDGTTTTSLVGSPAGTVAVVFKDRLFVVDGQSSASRIYYSDIADFTSWPSDNTIDVKPGDGETVTSFAILQDVILVFKWKKMYGLYVQGSEADWVLRLLDPQIGCISKYTVKEIEGFIYFVGARGVYRTDGVNIQELSAPIEPLFRTRLVDLSTIDLDAAAWWEDKYIVLANIFTPTSQTWSAFSSGQTWAQKLASRWGSSTPTQLFPVYHIRVGGWTAWDTTFTPFTFVEMHTAAPIRGLYCGSYNTDGKIFRLEDGQYQDDASSYECKFITKTYDFDQGSEMKRGKWTMLEFLGDGAATLTYIENDGFGDVVALTGTGGKRAHKVAGPGYFRNLAFQFAATHAAYVEIYSIVLHLHLKRKLIPSPV